MIDWWPAVEDQDPIINEHDDPPWPSLYTAELIERDIRDKTNELN